MILISPAKKLNVSSENFEFSTSEPVFFDNTKKLVKALKRLSSSEIKSLMQLSDSLSLLNYNRFQDFSEEQNPENSKPAAFIFSGDTFVGLDVNSFSLPEINYAQKNLRILSGLYGMLRPLDMVQPYRLEMGTKVNKLIDDSLYSFWENKVTQLLNKEISDNNSKFLLNLSSNEYFKCIKTSMINIDIINFKFLINKNGDLRQIGMFSKKCRGAMARFAIKNRISNIEDLKQFKDFGYSFLSVESNTFTFVKD